MRKSGPGKIPNLAPRTRGRSKSASTPLDGYVAWLASQPVAELTRRTYQRRVAAYLAWLAQYPAELDASPLSDTFARDYAIRDYKRHLKTSQKAAPASVNGKLAAIDQQRRFLRAVERSGRPRDTAIALVVFYTGIRLAECAALNVDDVVISARRGAVIVRAGKGDAYREVPLNTEVRQALSRWLAERAGTHLDSPTEALFLNRSGGRLSARSIHEVLARLATEAGVQLSARILRHTCLTGLVRAGNDLVMVAEIAGHRRLETTRRYSLPSTADREAAMEARRIDY